MAQSIEVRGVLIDMDGTAVDSNAIVEQSWAEFAEEFGLDLETVLAFSHGRPSTETFAKFVPSMGEAEIQGRHQAMLKREYSLAHLVVPILGADSFLLALDDLGVPWALVTSAPRSLAKARFTHAKLPWPAVNVPVDDIVEGKPHPEGYLKAAAALGVPADECVVFEDAPAGIRAGLNSGASVVVVDPGEPLDLSLLGKDRGKAGQIVAQVPNLESFRVEKSGEEGVFTLTW